MVRNVLTVVLLAAVALGQIAQPMGESRLSPRIEVIEHANLDPGFGFEYDNLRQGTEEFAEIHVSSSPTFAIGSPEGKDSRLLPTKLEIHATEGIQVSSVSFARSRKRRFRFDPKPFRVLDWADHRDQRIRFKVRAAQDLAPGEYELSARLSFQTVSDAGISEPQQVDVQIPIKVVAHKAKVNSVDRSIGGMRSITPGQWVEAILLAPITIPLVLLMTLVGWDGC